MQRKLLIGVLLLLFIYPVFTQQNTTDQVYTDKEFRFSIAYSKDWVPITPTKSHIKFKAIRDSAPGFADFNISTGQVKGIEDMTPGEFVGFLKDNPSAVLQILKSELPDGKVLEKGEISLSNRKAYYVKAEGTAKLVNDEVKIKVWLIVTVEKDRRYSMLFRSNPEIFDQYFPTFKQMINDFTILPK